VLTTQLKTRTSTKAVNWQFWDGQKLTSSRECPLAIDTETELITDERILPRLALAVASDGRTHVVIHPDRLGAFLQLHAVEHLVGHNVQFDFWVIDQHLRQTSEESARRILWDACDQGRLLDTQILDMLLQLATSKFRHAPWTKRGEAKVYPGNLADVAADYTALRLSKDDPYRLRFGELLGLGVEELPPVEAGFFTYAVADAVATRQLYPALAMVAYELMTGYGFRRTAERYEIRPDALVEFGYLSEVIQVKASIALAYMFRRGVHVDLEKARDFESRYRAELGEIIATLERDYRDVLSYTRDGQLRVTPKGRTPCLARTKLDPMLLQVVEEVKVQGHALVVPKSQGKKPDVSHSVKAWGKYSSLHPFLERWVRMTKLTKLLGFFAGMTASTLHCEYSLLMRTGRTSCSAPRSKNLPGLNLQQIPRDPEFRALFVPAPGHQLFTGDFAAVELRTLAVVCRARYGTSRLGDVIAEGVDPHAFTAAAIQGLSFEDFKKLKANEPERFKEARQAAKAINFGVPGGLGAQSLQAYAKANYGVTLTLEQAAEFKRKLINDIYPELNDRDGYLADPSMAALARNLGVTEREAWEAFDQSGERHLWASRGAAKVFAGTSTANAYYQAHVWEGLSRLTNTVHALDLELAELIGREQGGQRLQEWLYRQSVATLTGRLRANVSYTEGKNTPFQSLAADGAKLALWNLLYAGYDLYGFVHDEILVQLPASTAEAQAPEVARIMERALEEVMGHGLPAACEYGVADCWKKA
jgi:hypothetical protein